MKKTQKQHFLGILGLLLVTIIWGSGFTAVDIALGHYSPLQILSFRFLIGVVVMGFFAFPERKKIGKGSIRSGAVMGIFLFLAFWLQTVAQLHTTPSKNAFLTATNVVIVPFIAYGIYKVKVTGYHMLGAILTIIGVGVLSIRAGESFNIGDLYSFLCAIGFAFHIFFTGHFVKKGSAPVLNFIQMAIAFGLSFGAMLFSGGWQMNFSPEGFLAILYLGLFSTGLSFFLQTLSQKYTTETEAGIILSMESVFGTFFSVIILKEIITWKMVIGCVIILMAIFISEFGNKWFPGKKNGLQKE